MLIASWARGVELMISSKTMMSSYGKNLRNRFEESFGDAANIRGRFPLASIGYMFMVRSDIPAGDQLFLVDMLKKLRENGGYDACCLLVVNYEDGMAGTSLQSDMMDDELTPSRFFSRLVEAIIARTPVDHHVRVRERRAGAPLPIEEREVSDDLDDD